MTPTRFVSDIVEEMVEDVCERCGKVAPGREQWMFQQGETPAKQFFCLRCLRIMRVYAIIGFTLLGLLVVGLFGFAWWAGAF